MEHIRAAVGAIDAIWDRYFAMIEGDGGFILLLCLYVSMFLTERVIFVLYRRGEYNNRDALMNVITSSAQSIISALGLGAVFFTVYAFIYIEIAPFHLPNTLWVFLFAFVLNDFCYWLDHIISHRNNFFWTFHQTHHSSQEMNLTVAARGHVLLPLFQPVYLLLALCGVSFTQALAVKLIGNLWGIFNHTRLIGKMGPLENWLCTPANHRVHHGVQGKYLDRNYGQTLLIWDRIFGTWQREEEEPVYGLVKQLERQNPINIQTAPLINLWQQLRRAPTWRDRAGYLWNPPGWSHTGLHETSDVLRSRETAAPAE